MNDLFADDRELRLTAGSDWVVVQPGSSIDVEIDLTTEPGSYLARQATNVGGNVCESIVTIDLGSVEHPERRRFDA